MVWAPQADAKICGVSSFFSACVLMWCIQSEKGNLEIVLDIILRFWWCFGGKRSVLEEQFVCVHFWDLINTCVLCRSLFFLARCFQTNLQNRIKMPAQNIHERSRVAEVYGKCCSPSCRHNKHEGGHAAVWSIVPAASSRLHGSSSSMQPLLSNLRVSGSTIKPRDFGTGSWSLFFFAEAFAAFTAIWEHSTTHVKHDLSGPVQKYFLQLNYFS